jgi:hypothetical protein
VSRPGVEEQSYEKSRRAAIGSLVPVLRSFLPPSQERLAGASEKREIVKDYATLDGTRCAATGAGIAW